MSIKHYALPGIAIGGLVILSALTLHYRNEAARLQGELKASLGQSGSKTAETGADPTTPARRETAFSGQAQPEGSQDPSHETDELRVPPEEGSGLEMTNGASMEERMETLRRTDPAEYEKVVQFKREALLRRQAAEKQGKGTLSEVTSYLASRETSKMSPQQLADYNRLMTLLREKESLSQQWKKMAPEKRIQILPLVQANREALAPALEKERNEEYRDLAVALGHSGQDALVLAGKINQISADTLPGPGWEQERNQKVYALALEMGHSEADATAFVGYINQITDGTMLRSVSAPKRRVATGPLGTQLDELLR